MIKCNYNNGVLTVAGISHKLAEWYGYWHWGYRTKLIRAGLTYNEVQYVFGVIVALFNDEKRSHEEKIELLQNRGD